MKGTESEGGGVEATVVTVRKLVLAAEDEAARWIDGRGGADDPRRGLFRHHRLFAAVLLCASACGGAETPAPSTPPETAKDVIRLDRTRSFVRALVEWNVDELAAGVDYPLSFRLRGERGQCPDAATEAELAAWVDCVHEHIGRAFRARHSLETLDLQVYESRSEVGNDVLAMLSDARNDDIFVRASMFGDPDNVTLVLVYQRQPTVTVRTVWASLSVEIVLQKR